jgi:hypothetical protein
MKMNDIAAPIPIGSKVPLTLVTEKQSPKSTGGTDFSARQGIRVLF